MDLLDYSHITGERVATLLKERGVQKFKSKVKGEKGITNFIKLKISGTRTRENN